MEKREIELYVEYITHLTGCAVPTKTQKIPPKKYFETAVLYFQDVKEERAERPKAVDTEEKLDDCIKNSMIKYCLYEKALQDLIQQGFIPEIDETDRFWVAGWNISEPKK